MTNCVNWLLVEIESTILVSARIPIDQKISAESNKKQAQTAEMLQQQGFSNYLIKTGLVYTLQFVAPKLDLAKPNFNTKT